MGSGGKYRQGVDLEEIMRPAVSVTLDNPAQAVLKILLENRIPGVPVVDAEGYLVGFVSEGNLLASALPPYVAIMEDLSFVSEGGDSWVWYLVEAANRPVGEVMSREVSSVELGGSELAVAHKMFHDGASSVMVTQNGRLVGIVNRLDLYAAVVGIDADRGT
jgi:CBS domain-containing protein